MAVPPVTELYHCIVPALAVAERVNVPASHLESPVVPVIVGNGETVTVTVAVLLQPAALVPVIV